jgi:hypothetical protein
MPAFRSRNKSSVRTFNNKTSNDFNPFEVPSENQVYTGRNRNNSLIIKQKSQKRKSTMLTNIKRSQVQHSSIKSVSTTCSSTLSSTISTKKSVNFIRPFVEVIEIESYKQYNANIHKNSNYSRKDRKNRKEKIGCTCNVF